MWINRPCHEWDKEWSKYDWWKDTWSEWDGWYITFDKWQTKENYKSINKKCMQDSSLTDLVN